MMLDAHQIKVIEKIFEMLEEISVEDLEKADLYIYVTLKSRHGDFVLLFEDETGDWTVRWSDDR